MKKQHHMQFHRGNVKWMRRSLCILLSLCLLVTGIQLTINAVEKTDDDTSIVSLSAIEELKENYTSTGATFTILEVVPTLGTGSMGYYVPGQEPLSYGGEYFVDKFNLATITGALERETAVGAMTTDLEDLGILSGDADTALSTTEVGYTEYLAGITALEDIPEEAVRVDLVEDDADGNSISRTESIVLDEGDFEYKQNSTGEFIQENSGVTLNKESGNYVQAIDYFVYSASDLSEIDFQFYYVPTFEVFDLSDIENNDTLVSETYSGRAIYTYNTDSGCFVYFGSLGVNDVTLDLSSTETYYWVSNLDLVPYESADEALLAETPATMSLMSTNSLLGVDTQESDSATPGSSAEAKSASAGTNAEAKSASQGTKAETNNTIVEPAPVVSNALTSISDSPNAYVAVGDFVKVTDGATRYFDVDSAYIYQGENEGNFSYDPDAENGNPEVKYSYIYLDAGFTNNNWFRQYVLDDYSDDFADSFNIDVVEVLPTDLTQEKIEAASLVVFSAGFSLDFDDTADTYADRYTNTNDIKTEVNTYLKGAIADDGHKELKTPIVIDGNLQGTNTSESRLIQFINMSIIALVDQYGTDEDTLEPAERENINRYGAAEGGLYFIAQGDSFVTRFIATPFDFPTDANGYYTNYYSEVTSTIAYENFVRDTTGVEQLTGQPSQVSIATSIRHILMVGNQFSVEAKESIRVLEIQPAISSDDTNANNEQVLDEAQVKDWFPGVEDVEIDRMCSSEFIGKIDDITELYDVVYIGADFGNFNTRTDGTGQDQETIVDYNDDLMDGMFYTNIGDSFEVSSYTFVGLLNSDYANSDLQNITTIGSYYPLYNDIDTTYRFSGNDITTTKLAELKTFVTSGFPVVISDSLVGTTAEGEDQIRIDRVDKASYMYNFLSGAISESNVFTVNDLENSLNQIQAVQYLNLTKPSIVFADTGTPTEYTSDTQLSESLITDNTVVYTFKIENATDATPEDTLYSVDLYIDQDADGSHEENEILSELTVFDMDTNVEVSSSELKVGVVYKVSKELPSSYQGCIPWKLEVSIVGRESYHTSETGYTYIKPSDAIVIKILQIYETNTGKITDNYYYSKYIEEMGKAGIYDLQISTITIGNLNSNYTTAEAKYNYLNDYDMLVLGFGDGYGIKYDNGGLNATSSEAVTKFIDSGKAVLFAHDTSSTHNVPVDDYPTSSGGLTEVSGSTIMEWKTSTDQYSSYTAPSWGVNAGEWQDSNNNFIEIPVNNNEVYNYEEGEWGWWIAPTSYETGELSITSYAYTAIADSTTYEGTELPYWDATLGQTGEWGYYAYTANKLNWHSPISNSQPSDDVCYIYYDATNDSTDNPAWGWYKITVKNTEEMPDLITYTYYEGSENTTIGTYEVVWPTSYYFNTIIRDAVGLDRYGITNELYRSDFIYPYEYDENGDLLREDGLVANGYTHMNGNDITSDDIENILSQGYSIAYQPTSEEDWILLEETQGYATGDLTGRGVSQYNAVADVQYTFGDRTEAVSQVNQGQITTFPYNVNTSVFDESSTYGSTFSVSSTHHQYYQLNMNSEDVVVWYCLAGDAIAGDYGNDVTNFYYIYNIDNVTYTGAGHNDAGASTISVGEEEAKLFINTMISAYRAGRVSPTIDLVDENGVAIESIFFTTEETTTADVILATQGVAATEKMISFKIVDNNLENPESRKVSLTYTDSSGADSTIYYPGLYDSTGASASNVKLASNTLYTLALPDEVLTALSDIDENQITLTITVTSKFADGVELKAVDSIDIFKLNLQLLG
ncbi:MAG: DUF5057 domain-containing protein [Lachnospiraceae bacterium]